MKFFRRKSKKEKLQKQYEAKLAESHKMSKINRKRADELIYEAEQLIKQMKEED